MLQNGIKIEPDLHTLLSQLILMITQHILSYVTAECRLELFSKSPDQHSKLFEDLVVELMKGRICDICLV